MQFTDDAKDFFLRQDFEMVYSCLMSDSKSEIAIILKDIFDQRPKVCHVREWPEYIQIDNVDITILINGLISNCGCILVQE